MTQQWSSYRLRISEIGPKTETEIRTYVQSSLGFLRVTDTTISIVRHTAGEYLFFGNRMGDLLMLSGGGAQLTISWGCFRYLHHAFGDPEGFLSEGDRRHHNGSRNSSLGQTAREAGHQKLLGKRC